MADCEMPSLGIEVTFSSAHPHFPWHSGSAPCLLTAAPLGTLESSVELGSARPEALLKPSAWSRPQGSRQPSHDLQNLPTISEIISQHVGRGSQTRLLSWRGWPGVPRSALQFQGGDGRSKRSRPRPWQTWLVPRKEPQLQGPSGEGWSKS